MSTGRFEANTERLRQGTEEIGSLPERARQVGRDFVAHQAAYVGLNGYDDDFYHEVQPNYEANNHSLLRFVNAMADAYVELTGATFGALRDIEGTHQDAVDSIQLQSNRLDAYENDGGGKH